MGGDANTIVIFGLPFDRDIAILILGAILGGIIGFGSSFFMNLINNRTQRKKEEKEKAINIIAEVVKFATKTKNEFDNLKYDMQFFIKRLRRTEDAAVADEIEKIVAEKQALLKKEADNYAVYNTELQWHSFQLNRLGNNAILNKFNKWFDAANEYYRAILQIDSLNQVNGETVADELYENFVNSCLKILKKDASVCTLSAPPKKKGHRRKR
jgi:hypothetical protein